LSREAGLSKGKENARQSRYIVESKAIGTLCKFIDARIAYQALKIFICKRSFYSLNSTWENMLT